MCSFLIAGIAATLFVSVSSIRSKGGHRATKTHVATDYVWSDRRIELAADVITWLERLP